MKSVPKIQVEHHFRPDAEAVRRAISALLRLSEEARAAVQAEQAGGAISAGRRTLGG